MNDLGWKRHVWVYYLAATGVLTALYMFVPPFKGAGPLINALGFSGVVAILIGVRMHRPTARAACCSSPQANSPISCGPRSCCSASSRCGCSRASRP